MARLPHPGGDNGDWGSILNDYLNQSHKADGTIKDGAVTASTIAQNSVTNAALTDNSVDERVITDGSITETLLASAVQTKLNAPIAIADGSVTKTKLTADVQSSISKADNARSLFAPLVSPNSIAIMGDSIGFNNKYSTGTPAVNGYVTAYDGDKGFLNWALAYLNGRMTLKANVSVSGTRTDQWISAGQHTAIVSAAPTWCVIVAPTNDREQGVSLATSKSNYLTIITTLRDAGIKVLLLGLLPESAGSVGTTFTQAKIDYTINWNYWIKTLAATDPSIVAVDPFRVLAETGTTGGWYGFANPNVWTPDGLHPHGWATSRIGKLVADALEPLVPYLDIRPLLSIDRPSAGVLNGNILTGSGYNGNSGNNGSDKGGSGTVISNFGARSSDGANYAGTVVSSIVSSSDMDRVPWQQHTITGAVTKFRASQTGIVPSSGLYTPGVTIARPEVEIDIDSDVTNTTKLVLAMQVSIGSVSVESQWAFINTTGLPMEYRLAKDVRGRYPILVGPSMQIPSGATQVSWYLDFQGMGTFRWRNAALRTSPAF